MSRPKGRVDDMLIIRGVNVFPSEVERSVLQVEELTPNYQLFVSRNGHVDDVELKVELSEESFNAMNQTLDSDTVQRIKIIAEAFILYEFICGFVMTTITCTNDNERL